MKDESPFWKSKMYWEQGEKEYDVSNAFCGRIKHPENKHLRSRLESVTKIKYASDVTVPRESNWEYHPVNTKLNHEKELAMQVNKDWRRRVRQVLGTVDGGMSYTKPTKPCPETGEQIVGGDSKYIQGSATPDKIKGARESIKKNWELRNHLPIEADEKVYKEIKKLDNQRDRVRKINKVFLTKQQIAERKRLQKLKSDMRESNRVNDHKSVYGEEK